MKAHTYYTIFFMSVPQEIKRKINHITYTCTYCKGVKLFCKKIPKFPIGEYVELITLIENAKMCINFRLTAKRHSKVRAPFIMKAVASKNFCN